MAAVAQSNKSKLQPPVPTLEGAEQTVQVGATYRCRGEDGSYREAVVVKTRMNKKAGREEFYVRYVGLTQQQNEWVDKSRLLSKPVKDEDATNVQDQDMAENGDADQKAGDEAVTNVLDQDMAENGKADQKMEDEDGEPKAKRAKAEVTEASGHGSMVASIQVEMSLPVSMCPEHDERVKLYCKDDGDLGCIICRDSLKHKNHSFLPILDAVGVYRTQLPPMVTPLQEALKVTKQLNSQQSETIKQYKSDMEEHKQQISAEFERMHALLREQEEIMQKQLQEQEGGLLKTMETNLSKMQETQEKLEQAIATAEEKMKATDTNSYLTGMKSLLMLCEEQKARSSACTLITKKPSRHISKESIQDSVQKAVKSLIVPTVTQQQNEWVDKAPLLSKPVKDKDATNVQDQAMAESRKIDQKAKDEDCEPNAKRAKAEVTDARGHSSVMTSGDLSLPVSMCPEHDEQLKLYCKDDGDLGCIICRDSLKHAKHSFLPILDAVGVYRPQLPVWLTHLQEALKVTKQLNSQQSEEINQHKNDMEELKQQILAEFEKLQAILREQEGGLLKEMETNLAKIQANQEKLEQVIATAEEKTNATDTNSYLTGIKSLLTLCEEQKALSATHTLITKKLSHHFSKESIQDSVQKAVRSLIATLAERKNEPQLVQKPTTAPPSAEPTKEPQPVQPPDKAPELDSQVIDRSLDNVHFDHAKNGVQQVLLIGDELINSTRTQASQTLLGRNLGFPSHMLAVHWRRVVELEWCKLIPELKKAELEMKCRPDIIIIHLGEADLKKLNHEELAEMIKRDLRKIRAMYPSTVVMWSHMISRFSCLHTPLHQARQICNQFVNSGAPAGRYLVIAHKKVEKVLLGRWKQPLTPGQRAFSFTYYELNIINKDFILGIKKAINHLAKTRWYVYSSSMAAAITSSEHVA